MVVMVVMHHVVMRQAVTADHSTMTHHVVMSRYCVVMVMVMPRLR